MITVDEHLAEILANCEPLAPRDLALLDCLNATVATSLVAASPLPGFDNSAMDGYAVRSADVSQAPVTLTVTAEIAAGDVMAGELAPGTVARIMTGAALPQGADAVVPVEDTDGGSQRVRIETAVPAGAHVRRIAEDVAAGDILLGAGQLVRPAQVGLAAAAGATQLSVVPRPQVAIVSTGAELQPPGTELGPGRIFDSNAVTLAAMAKAAGLPVTTMACHSDDEAQFIAAITAAADGADLVLTSGGISAGSYEVVKSVLSKREGFTFRQVAMQPGKPQGFGRIGTATVLCLPGNPVSAAVSFMVFGRPLAAKLAGLPVNHLGATSLRSRLTEDVPAKPLRQFLRALRTSDGQAVTPSSRGGSHMLAGLAGADCLVVIPEGSAPVRARTEVEVIPLQ